MIYYITLLYIINLQYVYWQTVNTALFIVEATIRIRMIMFCLQEIKSIQGIRVVGPVLMYSKIQLS